MPEPVGRPRRSREATRQLWSERLARFAVSDLSVAAFCAAESVSPNSLFYWKRRLAEPAPLPAGEPLFLPVRVAPAAPVEVVLPGGVTLRLSPGCDVDFVRALVAALGASPC